MAIEKFKFVSPGVQFNEIDQSVIAPASTAIGPVVIGRTAKGPAMQPVLVSSVAELERVFGGVSNGKPGAVDVWRTGAPTAPTLGTYAARAFLRNSGPVTVVRLGGTNDEGSTTAGYSFDDVYGLFAETSEEIATEITEQNLHFVTDGGGVYTIVAATGQTLSNVVVGQRVVWNAAGLTEAYDARILDIDINTGGQDIITLDKSIPTRVASANPTLLPTRFYNVSLKAALAAVIYADGSEVTLKVGSSFVAEGSSATTTKSATIKVSGSACGEKEYPISFDPAATNYIRKVLSTNPSKVDSAATDVEKTYFLGETYEETAFEGTVEKIYLKKLASGFGLYDSVPQNAETPMIVSDHVNGGTPVELFKFVGLNNGTPLSREVKISIENVRASKNTTVTKYGTFDVVVRPLVETSTSVPLERYNEVTLDPTSANYIVKAVGDSWREYDAASGKYVVYGTTDNRSAYVRVEMAEGDLAAELLPHGYQAKTYTWAGTGTGKVLSHPSVIINEATVAQSSAKSKRFGFKVTSDIVDLLRYKPAVVTKGTELFSTRLVNVVDTTKYGVTAAYNAEDLLTKGSILGFDVPIHGGFDGLDITEEEPLINERILDSKDEYDSYAYRSIKQAIDLVADPESVDMSILCVPGLKNVDLTSHMIEVCKTRGDAMTLIDLEGDYKYAYETNAGTELRPTKPSEAGGVIANLLDRQIDNSYGAAYFPAVFSAADGIFLPASIAALGAYGGTEGRSALWFAPAGFNRGGLTEGSSGVGVSRTAYSLNASERDALYAANINPIATFPGEGVVIFGQKTLQVTPSALDRVNVRRLANFIKKQVSRVATRVLFEPNVENTWKNFKKIVDPFLLAIKNAYGLDDAKVVLDETTTTADLIDRNIKYCKIYIKPTRAIEYIAIDFIVTNSGAAFSE